MQISLLIIIITLDILYEVSIEHEFVFCKGLLLSVSDFL